MSDMSGRAGQRNATQACAVESSGEEDQLKSLQSIPVLSSLSERGTSINPARQQLR